MGMYNTDYVDVRNLGVHEGGYIFGKIFHHVTC